MSLPKRIDELSAASIVSAGAYFPVVSGGLTKSARLTAASIALDLFNIKDPAFGAVGDGTTDDSAAIQAAINAGNGIFLPAGTYAVASSLTITSKSGFRMIGNSSGGATLTANQAVLKWTGGAGGTLLKCTGTRDSLFQGFNITVGSAPSTLAVAIDFDPTGRTQAETANSLRNIGIVQRGGATAIDNTLAKGIQISRGTSAGNVDDFSFYDLNIAGCSTAAISIEDAQSKAHRFYNLTISYCAIGMTNNIGSDGQGGGFSVNGGDIGNNTLDFDITPAFGPVSISNVHSEGSTRFAIIRGSVAAETFIQGVSYDESSLHADGLAIKCGVKNDFTGGFPLVLTHNTFGSAGGTAVKLALWASGFNGTVVSLGNWFNSSAPYVNGFDAVGPGAKIISKGDRYWNGSASVPLPVITTFADGDTSPTVGAGFNEVFLTSNTGVTSIVSLDDPYTGQVVRIIMGDANTRFIDASPFKLAGAFSPVANDTITLAYDGTNWNELGRSSDNRTVPGSLQVGSTVSIGGALVVSVEGFFGHTTTAGAANVYIDATSKLLQRSTSSLRYKDLEGEMGLVEAQKIIFNAKPINFKSRNDGSRHFGFAAEWMSELDARTVTLYKGNPDWVEYPILTAPLTKVAQDHEERLKAIEDLLKGEKQ